LRPSPPSPR
jgi:nucleoside-diphosphate-sugar epimerase